MTDTATKQSGITTKDALFEYLLRMADDRLILGHRLSEWCGHGPILEEDIALTNISLDYIGHATSLLEYAGEVEDKSRDEDDIAFFRDTIDYKCIKMVELPKGDFGFTIARQFLFSVFSYLFYNKLKETSDDTLRGMAQKALKETRYHIRHSREWVLHLGDGTDESHHRIQKAFNELWMYTDELFYMDETDQHLVEKGIGVDLEQVRPDWKNQVEKVLNDATLNVPSYDQYMAEGGRIGIHTEYLGYLLAEMQRLPRSYPDAQW